MSLFSLNSLAYQLSYQYIVEESQLSDRFNESSSNKGLAFGTTTRPLDEKKAQVDIDSQEGFDLNEIWKAIRRRKKILFVTSSIVILFTGVKTIHEKIYKPVYKGDVTFLISDPISAGTKTEATGSAVSSASLVYEQLARNNTTGDIPTLISYLKSPFLLEPLAKEFNTPAKAIANQLSIKLGDPSVRGGKTAKGILVVTLYSEDPSKGQVLLEAITDTFLQATLQRRLTRLSEGLEFLNQQAPELERKTSLLQSKLEEFRRINNLVEPEREANYYRGRQQKTLALMEELRLERRRLIDARKGIEEGTLTANGFKETIGQAGESAVGLVSSENVVFNQLIALEAELAKARLIYTPNSKVVKGIESRLSKLRPLIVKSQLSSIDLALKNNSKRINYIEDEMNGLNEKFMQQPELMKEYENMKSELFIANNNVIGLMKARERFQLEMAQKTTPWTVISKPSFGLTPVEPSLKKGLSNGLFLGLFAGAAVALLRDRFDHVYHSPAEVKEEIDLPLLGHIPFVDFFTGVREGKRFLLKELDDSSTDEGSEDQVKEKRYQRFFYQEAFRNVYTSIRFLNSGTPLKTIALTSSLPAEGKSLVNVLLAKTISEMGLRVLQVDADMRKPQLHYRLGLNNLTGLSNLITDENLNWTKVLQNVPDYDNWKLISAGTLPPDPTRLLSSKEMNKLVKKFSEEGEFDIILIDTPPILGLADSSLVASHCDGLLLLIGLNKVDRSLPKESVNRVQDNGGQIIGIITNALKKSNFKNKNSYEMDDVYMHYAEDSEVIDNASEIDNYKDVSDKPFGLILSKLNKIYIKIKEKASLFLEWVDN